MSDFDEFWDSSITYNQLQLIEMLLEEVKLDDRELDKITLMLHQSPSESEAEELITYLNSRKVDHISSGFPYSKTDIVKKLRNEI